MTKILRSATKKFQNNEDLSSKLSISKKSKNIKKIDNKAIEIKNEVNQQDKGWNITDILSNIFAYTDRKDLVEFNTVCKKWNNLTNPIIHKTIKLDSKWDAKWQREYKKNNNAAKINADVVECISNNAKHAPFVKDFKFNYKMNPQRAVKVFETFRFICKLTIEGCDMKQEQFLGMISPLVQLKELTLKYLYIRNVIKKKPYKAAIQLPSSLKKLSMSHVRLTDNPELFVKTINSHRNLVEFNWLFSPDNVYLEPFYKHYPSLLNFKFEDYELDNPQSLYKIFESNPQLISLKLYLRCMSGELVNYICNTLINLEEIGLSKNESIHTDHIDHIDFAKFSQPTKIRKLYISWGRLSNCSLNSILLNCPHLEELELNQITYMQPDSVKSISFSNPSKLKKLAINCGDLSEGVFDSVLLSCPHIKELNIILPLKWKEAIKSINEKCINLQRLNIFPSGWAHIQDLDTFCQEFYESEFFTNNHKSKSTLTNLTLNRFKAHGSKAEYFKNFEKLKSIKYTFQNKIYHFSFAQEVEIDMDLWLGYKKISKDNIPHYDIEFKKLLI
ncbi:RNI-like protein [Conidiobolus coronatus NRRL 28638]|uniref:RNI-like protein n=1 Tax=Conidiobolus coronatus (strain ATCC 28846 / CBS 209.66 / NRRL 28638) TaxID=796925 RepID=A0A137NSV2_CONC2|nr:RNI-like protein [Conidiobolus coronatus NRRL 28638]|eukprot:KXN65819.1 RNI-like protein [Conidiobolus coronatus NRRL 28638]